MLLGQVTWLHFALLPWYLWLSRILHVEVRRIRMPGMKWNEHMSHMWTPVGLGSEKSHLSRGGWVLLGPTRQQRSEGSSSCFPIVCRMFSVETGLPTHTQLTLWNWDPFNFLGLSLQSSASKVTEGLMKKNMDLPPWLQEPTWVPASPSSIWLGQTSYPCPSFLCLLLPLTFRTRVSKRIEVSHFSQDHHLLVADSFASGLFCTSVKTHTSLIISSLILSGLVYFTSYNLNFCPRTLKTHLLFAWGARDNKKFDSRSPQYAPWVAESLHWNQRAK